MKKILLTAILIAAFISGNSQSLTNTEWFGTNFPSPNLYFRFSIDTLYYSTTSYGYTPLSIYTASGGQFSVFDLPGTMCTDIGYYHYSISGNNLIFTLISDNCSSRMNTLVNYNWLSISTGIADLQKSSSPLVFPNPISDGIFTLSIPDFVPGNNEIIFYDVSGKIVYNQKLQLSKTDIDISFLPDGIYT